MPKGQRIYDPQLRWEICKGAPCQTACGLPHQGRIYMERPRAQPGSWTRSWRCTG